MSKEKRTAPPGVQPLPPKETRFKPGQSGNPKGRPPKQRAPGKLDPLQQAFQEALVEEGRRPVTLSEGGKQVTIPASQAVLRAAFVAAIKGNPHAQKTLIAANLDIERRAQKEHAEQLDRALELKFTLEQNLRQWLASGRPEEDIRAHPADIEIDPQTLDVCNHIPLCAEAFEARAMLVHERNELLKSIAFDEGILGEVGKNEVLSSHLEYQRELLRGLNDALPPRFRKERLDRVTLLTAAGGACKLPSGNRRPDADIVLREKDAPPGDSGCPS